MWLGVINLFLVLDSKMHHPVGSKLWETVKDREAWRTAARGVEESDMTWQLNNNRRSLVYIYMSEVKVTQSCQTLCDSMDYTVHGIHQARILEKVPSPGLLPSPGIEPRSPTLQVDSLPAEPQGKPYVYVDIYISNTPVSI